MHIYFSGIGGTGIGPLALIAQQAGFTVSGSDKQQSQYTDYLQKHGVLLHYGQTYDQIAAEHAQEPIDWLVYSSALPLEQPNHPELTFAQEKGIKMSKRDECINYILQQTGLSMIAAAGTHGKTTTTAMMVWLFKELSAPISYSVGAKISFGDMGSFNQASKYFVYECDEFDKNFLQFFPEISVITSIDWDHHEIYPTREDYKAAFRQFIEQSKLVFMFAKDAEYLGITKNNVSIIADDDAVIAKIALPGEHNRRNARLAIAALQSITQKPIDELIAIISRFPGTSRRFETIAPGLYSDYAHTPEEIAATIQLAKELSQKVVVVYEPLTDRRQHYMKDSYHQIFEDLEKVYWLPSYLAREDTNQEILTPQDFVQSLSSNTNAVAASKDETLEKNIQQHLAEGALVICLAGGGGGSLDEWIRQVYPKPA